MPKPTFSQASKQILRSPRRMAQCFLQHRQPGDQSMVSTFVSDSVNASCLRMRRGGCGPASEQSAMQCLRRAAPMGVGRRRASPPRCRAQVSTWLPPGLLPCLQPGPAGSARLLAVSPAGVVWRCWNPPPGFTGGDVLPREPLPVQGDGGVLAGWRRRGGAVWHCLCSTRALMRPWHASGKSASRAAPWRPSSGYSLSVPGRAGRGVLGASAAAPAAPSGLQQKCSDCR